MQAAKAKDDAEKKEIRIGARVPEPGSDTETETEPPASGAGTGTERNAEGGEEESTAEIYTA